MRLTVLGSGTAAPNPRRGAPGYLLQAGNETLLIDCGAGTVDRLLRAGGDPRQLDRVVFTHHHMDHFGEIGHLLFSARLPEQGRSRPLTLVGSGPLLELVAAYRAAFAGGLEPRGYTLQQHDLDAAALSGDGYRLEGHPVDHVPSSRALRLQDDAGRVLALSGDTGVCDGVVAAARDADLFVCEASFPEGRGRRGHLVPSEAGMLAAQAGARRLLLSHFYPQCDDHDMASPAAAAFGSGVMLAEDGMVIDLPAGDGAQP